MICSSVNFDRFIVRSFKVGRTLASDGGVIWGHSSVSRNQPNSRPNAWESFAADFFPRPVARASSDRFLA